MVFSPEDGCLGGVGCAAEGGGSTWAGWVPRRCRPRTTKTSFSPHKSPASGGCAPWSFHLVGGGRGVAGVSRPRTCKRTIRTRDRENKVPIFFLQPTGGGLAGGWPLSGNQAEKRTNAQAEVIGVEDEA